MHKIANINKKDLDALFLNASMKSNIHEAIIEKDFWVTLVLDYLFHDFKYKNNIAFKGGTSLSKCYGLIKRFSEDIDLILDWRVLGYTTKEPWNNRSNTKQEAFNKDIIDRTKKFLLHNFLPTIKKDLSKKISHHIDVYLDINDCQTIIIEYENAFKNLSILPVIRLEIGALSAWTSLSIRKISPYVADIYPNIFVKSSTDVLTVLPERTFWEKATILHKEANRPITSQLPIRYSRHYYDLFCMSQTSIKNIAFKKLDLLKEVVEFKKKFYHCGYAKYDDAKCGTIKLMPNDYFIKALKEDYEHMKNMIYGDKPSFNELLCGIKRLEEDINSLNEVVDNESMI